MAKLKFIFYLVLVVGLFLFLKFKKKDYNKIPAFKTTTTINAVVKISAGSNHEISYNPLVNIFKSKLKNGEEDVIHFLPYPYNVGFVPSTYRDTLRGGKGEPLEVLIISESKSVKTVMAVNPFALIRIEENKKKNDLLVAIPANKDDQIIDVSNLREFKEKYPDVKKIIELWLANYKGKNSIKIIKWEDKNFALKEVATWVQ
ncbi:MAG: hypothetical protein GXO79_16235 [Chlorobi bacterium]|nr:hypothetical protein [Chlorobiota bacterium]